MSEEDQIQCAFIEYIGFKFPTLNFFHTPNGGKRHKAEAAKFKKMGVKSGVADLYFMDYKTFLEIKTKKGRQSKKQKKFENICYKTKHGYHVVYGIDEAIEWLNNLVTLTNEYYTSIDLNINEIKCGEIVAA